MHLETKKFKAHGEISGTGAKFSYPNITAHTEDQCRAIVHSLLNKKYGRHVFPVKTGFAHSRRYEPFDVELVREVNLPETKPAISFSEQLELELLPVQGGVPSAWLS